MKNKLNERCKKCGMSSIVTKTFNGTPIEEKDYYWQCLANMESECLGKGVDMNEEN